MRASAAACPRARPAGRQVTGQPGCSTRSAAVATRNLPRTARARAPPRRAGSVPSLTSGIVPIGDRPQRLLDVIPRGPGLEGTDMYAYLREIKREHKAAETAPGALKPTSAYQVEKVEDTAKMIAHVSEPVRRQDLED